tara:strand:+ start:1300 stop:2295 length:996 start_codon:yes stop_codon:yes gene_type:complete
MGQYAVPNTDPITEAHVLTSGDTGPWEEGFRKSYRMKIGYQGTAGAAHFYGMQYRIESQDIASSGWNYNSSTSHITLSFWIKSSVSYNPSWYLRAKDGTEKIYRWQPGMLVSNTWTKLIKTFPGNSSLTFDNNNEEGLQINLSPYWGTNYSSADPTMDTWENFNSATRAKDTDPIWFETNGTTTEITGLQLEVGSQATKFEHLPYAEDLRRCQRYYAIFHPTGQEQVYIESGGTQSHSFVNFPIPPGMRSEPSVSLDGTWTGGGMVGGRTVAGASVQTVDNGGLNGTTHPGSMGRVSVRITRSGSSYSDGTIRHTDAWQDGAAWLSYSSEL